MKTLEEAENPRRINFLLLKLLLRNRGRSKSSEDRERKMKGKVMGVSVQLHSVVAHNFHSQGRNWKSTQFFIIPSIMWVVVSWIASRARCGCLCLLALPYSCSIIDILFKLVEMWSLLVVKLDSLFLYLVGARRGESSVASLPSSSSTCCFHFPNVELLLPLNKCNCIRLALGPGYIWNFRPSGEKSIFDLTHLHSYFVRYPLNFERSDRSTQSRQSVVFLRFNCELILRCCCVRILLGHLHTVAESLI